MLYQHSLTFRVNHWWQLLKARPRLFGAKVLHRLSLAALTVMGVGSDRMPPYMKKLEATISTRDVR